MTSNEYIWQHLQTQARMRYLLTTGHLSDCSFNLVTDENDGITVKCHKFVLVCSSPVFERMFHGDFVEARNSENIVLDDVSAIYYKAFIEYLYLRDKNLANAWNLRTLQNIIYLAQKFMVEDLLYLCVANSFPIMNWSTMHEILDFYTFAHRIDHPALINAVNWYLKFHPLWFLASPDIFDLSFDIFLRFTAGISNFHDSDLNADLFIAIEKYCIINGLIKKSQGKFDFQSIATGNDIEKKTESEEKKEEEEEKEKEIYKGKDKSDGNEIYRENDINRGKEKEAQAQIKEYIAKLLSYVRFETMTTSIFMSGPALSSILDYEMKMNILLKILKPSI